MGEIMRHVSPRAGQHRYAETKAGRLRDLRADSRGLSDITARLRLPVPATLEPDRVYKRSRMALRLPRNDLQPLDRKLYWYRRFNGMRVQITVLVDTGIVAIAANRRHDTSTICPVGVADRPARAPAQAPGR